MTAIYTKVFWADALERAVKTAAQAPLTAYGVSLAAPFDAFDLDWGLVAGFALGGFAMSTLTSLASAPLGRGTASILPAVAAPLAPVVPPPDPLPPP